MKLILASTSAARRAMLTAAGVPHVAIPNALDEDLEKQTLIAQGLPAESYAVALATAKARSVIHAGENALILGCDQILVHSDGTIFDKPITRARLVDQLAQLSGQTHRLYSAAVIIENNHIAWQGMEHADLTMRHLSSSYMIGYAADAKSEILSCVGGYQIESEGIQLFSKIQGSHFAILGLPLIELLAYLRHRGLLLS